LKKLVILIILIAVPSLSLAQEELIDKGPSSTQLESFLSRKGRLMVKDFYRLGETFGEGRTSIIFDAIVISEPGLQNKKIKGIRIEINEGGRLERKTFSFLDLEEVEGLSKAIDYIIELAEKWKGVEREPYTEVSYSSKSNFTVGFFQKEKERSGFVKNGVAGSASLFIETERFIMLKKMLDKGIMTLAGK